MPVSSCRLVASRWCAKNSSSVCLAHARGFCVTDKSFCRLGFQKSFRPPELKSTAQGARKCTCPARNTSTSMGPTLASASQIFYSRHTPTSTPRTDRSPISLLFLVSKFSAWRAQLTKKSMTIAARLSTSRRKRSFRNLRRPRGPRMCLFTSRI